MGQEFTRARLFDAVWADPIQAVAARVGISDVALAKTCKRAGIPVPERGYWAKLRAGKRTTKPSLPARPLGMLDHIEIGQRSLPRPASLAAFLETPPCIPVFSEALSAVAERVQTMVGQLRIVKNFAKAHPAIEKLLQGDERRQKRALEIPHLSFWDGPVFQTPFENRRLVILNTLFLALSRCGASPSLRGREARELSVKVGDTHISFTLDRPTPGPTKDSWHNTGQRPQV